MPGAPTATPNDRTYMVRLHRLVSPYRYDDFYDNWADNKDFVVGVQLYYHPRPVITTSFAVSPVTVLPAKSSKTQKWNSEMATAPALLPLPDQATPHLEVATSSDLFGI
ncbi:hypothetical protein V6N12_004379 [Hibiscus sabdariffa]|uniref:Uncharacterized protein n=1 Tax=Hibiscus sabdariffa TaxID=183260 RepID=A0ABR2CLC2_9ROSI